MLRVRPGSPMTMPSGAVGVVPSPRDEGAVDDAPRMPVAVGGWTEGRTFDYAGLEPSGEVLVGLIAGGLR
jgi:hypothetical protein